MKNPQERNFWHNYDKKAGAANQKSANFKYLVKI